MKKSKKFRWPEQLSNKKFQIPCTLIGFKHRDEWFPGQWQGLTSAAKAVLPVLLFHSHNSLEVFPSLDRISAFSGLKEKTAIKGCRDLEQAGLISISKRRSRNKVVSNSYTFSFAPNKGRTLLINGTLIDGGVWSRLKPTSKGLYIAMRFLAKPNPELDPDSDVELYGDWVPDNDEYQDYLNRRTVDYCTASKTTLVEYSGITRRSIYDALPDLEKNRLVFPTDEPNTFECNLEGAFYPAKRLNDWDNR